MLLISKEKQVQTINAFSELSGIPKHLLQQKLTRLGINYTGYVSYANQEYLQEIYIKEANDSFILTFSKINYQE